ncbi:MAG: hypothetical protein U9Q68_02320 [Euryarchaeota archaeon]|nr:hypothetical protein [Euryarchaeota archaeon]
MAESLSCVIAPHGRGAGGMIRGDPSEWNIIIHDFRACELWWQVKLEKIEVI